MQNTLLQMLPAGERAGAAAALTLNSILQSASNLRRDTGIGVVGDNQGKAEGDVLENVLNALADLAVGPAASCA